MLGLVPQYSIGKFGDVVSLADGRIFYAGSYVSPQPNDTYISGLLVGRLNTDGTADATFHLERAYSPSAFLSGGQLIYVQRVKVQADGKILILVVAASTNPLSDCFGVIRLMPDGATDTTFGHGSGLGCYAPTVLAAPNAYANDFVQLPGGGMLIAGPVGNRTPCTSIRCLFRKHCSRRLLRRRCRFVIDRFGQSDRGGWICAKRHDNVSRNRQVFTKRQARHQLWNGRPQGTSQH
jgi:hypothetical protein